LWCSLVGVVVLDFIELALMLRMERAARVESWSEQGRSFTSRAKSRGARFLGEV
jgi:hypothetical protein